MKAKILSAEVRRPPFGPDRVVLKTDGWGDFEVDVPRGGGPDYAATLGLGSVALVTSKDGFSSDGERLEVGPKARPDDATAEVAFASALIKEPEEGGAVSVVLDTRGSDGSNEGPYAVDFELSFPGLIAAETYLRTRGFSEVTVVKPRPSIWNGGRRKGSSRVDRKGRPVLFMLPKVEVL